MKKNARTKTNRINIKGDNKDQEMTKMFKKVKKKVKIKKGDKKKVKNLIMVQVIAKKLKRTVRWHSLVPCPKNVKKPLECAGTMKVKVTMIVRRPKQNA